MWFYPPFLINATKKNLPQMRQAVKKIKLEN